MPYFETELVKLYCGDCLEVMKELQDETVDAVITDPPYGLGFMGKKWDGTGIENNVEMWRECLRVLKPGGYLLSFGGSRTEHRMVCAIEDAGFEIRDKICWIFGSGFPKSLNIGKAVDKLQGNEREILGIDKTKYRKDNDNNNTYAKHCGQTGEMTKGTSEWEGWGTALKPAVEYICMARKPLSEKTVALNVLKYGTGGINIDESRVGTEKIMINGGGGGEGTGWGKKEEINEERIGRFPANLIHDNSDEVRACFPETGKSKSGGKGKPLLLGEGVKDDSTIQERGGYDDNGGNASRFFKSIIYQAKASKAERNAGCKGLEEKPLAFSNQAKAELKRGNTEFDGGDAKGHGNKIRHLQNNHPTVKPVALMQYLINMVTPKGGTVLDPFAGSGTTGIACRNLDRDFIGIEMDESYCAIAEARINMKEDQLKVSWR